MGNSHFSGPIYSANGFVSTGGLSVQATTDNMTANAGATQATGTPITTAISRFTTVATAGNSATLPVSTAGMRALIINAGANPIAIFPAGTDTINGLPASTSDWLQPGDIIDLVCSSAGTWSGAFTEYVTSFGVYQTNTATSGATLTAANVTGGTPNGTFEVTLNMTGTLGAGANAQMPTVAAVLGVLGGQPTGSSYKLRVINSSSANFAWTVTTNTGWTLTGTMTVAQNTWRDFYITFTGAAAATLQSIGTGTYS